MVRGSIVAHHAKRQTVTEKDLECLAKLDSANSASAIVPSESSKPKKRKVSKWEPCAFSAVVAMSDRELIGRDFVSTLSEWCGFGGLLLVSQQGVGRHRLCQWTKKSIRFSILCVNRSRHWWPCTSPWNAGATLATRQQKVREILEKRGACYQTVAHKAAFALDPRVVSLLSDPNMDTLAGFPVRGPWQDALNCTMSEFIPMFFAVEAGGARRKKKYETVTADIWSQNFQMLLAAINKCIGALPGGPGSGQTCRGFVCTSSRSVCSDSLSTIWCSQSWCSRFFSQWATKPPASGYGHSLGYLGRESRNVGTQLGQIVKAMHPNQKQFVSKLQKKVAETCHELELVVSRSFQCMEVATRQEN